MQFDFDDLNTMEIRLDSARVDIARLERGRLNEWPPLIWRPDMADSLEKRQQ